MDTTKRKVINTQYVFSESNVVLINLQNKMREWYPINFQWVPVTNK
ncbi:hypothetical protein KO566_09075 [Flavobacteriaceae bacterium XHP0103]|nr:hypothetical protein [Marixanthotalea marina]